MSRVKAVWAAVMKGPGVFLHHEGAGRTNVRYRVSVRVTITEGPEKGRDVRAWLTPSEALVYSVQLRNEAIAAMNQNKEEGFRDGA
jgi:hypothetical protein